MLKFIRKYQLLLLVVGGSLLMVVFLIEPVLRNFAPDPRKEVIATWGPDETAVRRGDLMLASQQTNLLRRFDPLNTLALDPTNTERHWLMLGLEAERMGVLGVSSDADIWLRDAAVAFATQQRILEFAEQVGGMQQAQNLLRQNPNFQLALQEEALQRVPTVLEQFRDLRAQLIADQGWTPEMINQTFSQANAIRRLRRVYQQTPVVSDIRERSVALRDLSVGLADTVFLRADLLLPQVGEPSNEELLALFNANRDEQRNATEANEYGIGYRRPPRIQAEWIELNADTISQGLTLDPIAVRERWRRDNPEAAAEDFNVQRGAVEIRMRRELGEEILEEADEIVRGQIRTALADLPRDGNRYDLTGYDIADRPDLAAIAELVVERVRERRGVTIPLPVYSRITDRNYTQLELQNIPVFAQTTYRSGSVQMPASQLPLVMPGAEQADSQAARAIRPQVGIPMFNPPATNASGSRRVYATVLAAKERSGPESIESVRNDVVNDWRSIRAYEMLLEMKPDIALVAEVDGIDKFDDTGLIEVVPESELAQSLLPSRNQRFSRPQPNALEFQAEIQNAVMEAAEGLEASDEESTIVIVEAPVESFTASRGLYVARVHTYLPLTIEDFRQSEEQIRLRLLADELNADSAFVDPFSIARLEERLGYVSTEDPDEDEFAVSDEGEEEDTAEDAAG